MFEISLIFRFFCPTKIEGHIAKIKTLLSKTKNLPKIQQKTVVHSAFSILFCGVVYFRVKFKLFSSFILEYQMKNS